MATPRPDPVVDSQPYPWPDRDLVHDREDIEAIVAGPADPPRPGPAPAQTRPGPGWYPGRSRPTSRPVRGPVGVPDADRGWLMGRSHPCEVGRRTLVAPRRRSHPWTAGDHAGRVHHAG